MLKNCLAGNFHSPDVVIRAKDKTNIQRIVNGKLDFSNSKKRGSIYTSFYKVNKT